VQFDGRRAASVRPAPLLGEHDAAIRAAAARGGWPGTTAEGGASHAAAAP